MKASELREKTVEELQEELLTLRRDQLGKRIEQSTGQLNQTHTVRELRRDVARIKTVLNEKAGE